MYDITSPDTFKRAQAWVKELRQQANQNIVIALSGNKADLAQQRMVETEVNFSGLNFPLRVNLKIIGSGSLCERKRTIIHGNIG